MVGATGRTTDHSNGGFAWTKGWVSPSGSGGFVALMGEAVGSGVCKGKRAKKPCGGSSFVQGPGNRRVVRALFCPAPDRAGHRGALLSAEALQPPGVKRRNLLDAPAPALPARSGRRGVSRGDASEPLTGLAANQNRLGSHRRISLLHLRGVPWVRIGEQVGQRDLAVTANTYSHVAGRGRSRLRGAACLVAPRVHGIAAREGGARTRVCAPPGSQQRSTRTRRSAPCSTPFGSGAVRRGLLRRCQGC